MGQRGGRYRRNTAQAIARVWDRLCEEYARDLRRLSKRKALVAIELAAIRAELRGRSGLLILDAGCGPGWHAAELARDGHRVVAVDVSPVMLEKAAATVDAAGMQERVHLCLAEIRALWFDAEPFDAVISCGTVVSDCGGPDAALAEFARVARPEGLVMASVRSLRGWLALCEQEMSAQEREALLSAGRHCAAGHSAFDWHMFTREGLDAACRAAGLRLLRVYPVACAPPPETEEGLVGYVADHVRRVDEPAALAEAHELFAVASPVSQGREAGS